MEFPSSPTYRCNLQALETYHSQLAETLREPFEAPHLLFQMTPSGAPTLIVAEADGTRLALHRIEDPVAEAQAWAEQQDRSAWERPLRILLGTGLGYPLLAVRPHLRPGTITVAIEPDPAVFQRALAVCDLTEMLASPDIRWVVGDAPRAVERALDEPAVSHRLAASGLIVLGQPTLLHHYRAYSGSLAKTIERTRNNLGLRIQTRVRIAQTILTHLTANIGRIPRGGGIRTLQDRYATQPAIVAAAGPSLNEALPVLKKHQRHAAIIAVDTTYPVLRAAGIEPLVVVALDPTPENALRLKGIERPRTILAAYPGVHPDIVRPFDDRVIWFDLYAESSGDQRARPTSLLEHLGVSPILGSLFTPGSTTHGALALAKHFGCAPIICTGLDLGYPDERDYADGVLSAGEDHLARLKVPSNDGGEIPSNQAYAHFRETMPEFLRVLEIDAVNTSRRGARIDGMPYRPWTEIEIPGEEPLAPLEIPPADPELAGNASRVLERSLADLDRIVPRLQSINKALRRNRMNKPDSATSCLAIAKEFVDLLSHEPLVGNALELCLVSAVEILGGGTLQKLASPTLEERQMAHDTLSKLAQETQEASVRLREAFQSMCKSL